MASGGTVVSVVVAVAAMLTGPLATGLHARCRVERHACDQTAVSRACCCHVIDGGGVRPEALMSTAIPTGLFVALPPTRVQPAVPGRVIALRIPSTAPGAGLVSLITLFGTRLI